MRTTFWDRVAGLYDLAEKSNGRAVRGMCAYVAQRVPEGDSFLECAAGTGAVSLAAAARAGRVLCTDLSQPMLDRAEAKARRLGVGNMEFLRRDLLSLPDGDGSFGVVTAANVLHLLPRPELAVGELWRVTRPGGQLILPTFLQGEAGAGFRLVIRAYRLMGFQFRHAFTRESYRAFFQGLGLPVEAFTVIGGRLPVGVAVLRKPEERNA